jgi:Kelch motif
MQSMAPAWRVPLLLALTAFIFGCDGSTPDGVVGPNLAVTGTRLVFKPSPPSNTTAGATISPAVKAVAEDQFGNKAKGFTGTVTVAIQANPGGGTLSGTTTVTAVGGVATFSTLSIDKAGTGYTLQATSGTLTPGTSTAFNITVGPKKQLAFTVQPSNTTVGAPISPAVKVTAQDAFGNTVTAFKGNIAMAIGTNPGGGALSGTTAIAAVGGVATFSNLRIDKVGTGYTLRATSGTLTAAISAPFDIKPVGDFWTTQASMPTARYVLGVTAALDGSLYAVGGDNNAFLLQTLERFDPANGWDPDPRAPMPTVRGALAFAELNGLLYAVGGYYNDSDVGPSPLSTLEAYNPQSNTWLTTTAPMPTARSYLGAAAIGGKLYAVGGQASLGVYLATLEAYDPITNAWDPDPKPPMPTARYGIGVAAIDGILYAVGGYSNNYLATVEAYNTATNTWQTKAEMSIPRLGPGVVAINGILYAVGGYSSNGRVATIEAYNPATNTWTTKTSMPTARYHLGATAINGILYAVGGFNGTSALAAVEAYHP